MRPQGRQLRAQTGLRRRLPRRARPRQRLPRRAGPRQRRPCRARLRRRRVGLRRRLPRRAAASKRTSMRASLRRGRSGRSRCRGRSARGCCAGCRRRCWRRDGAAQSAGIRMRRVSGDSRPRARDARRNTRRRPTRSSLDHSPATNDSPAPSSPRSRMRRNSRSSWIRAEASARPGPPSRTHCPDGSSRSTRPAAQPRAQVGERQPAKRSGGRRRQPRHGRDQRMCNVPASTASTLLHRGRAVVSGRGRTVGAPTPHGPADGEAPGHG